jgi:hypothetical protein
MAYGLGWQLGSGRDIATAGHGGSQQGTSATLLIAPESRAGVVVMTNADGVDAGGLAVRILGTVLGLPARARRTAAVDPALYDRLVGTYQLMDFSVAVAREGGGLFVRANGNTIPLSPVSDRDYAVGDSDNEITFVADGNGRATALITHEGGADLYLTRVQ